MTFVLVFITTGLFAQFCLDLLYTGVQFYHSSVSRGTFHIFFYAFVLFAAASVVCAIIFIARQRQESALISRQQVSRFIFLSHGIIWLAVSLLILLILVFYELPSWQPIRGG